MDVPFLMYVFFFVSCDNKNAGKKDERGVWEIE
jgi:hypothetical protein